MQELKRIRKERGLSQARLAELAGVDKVTIVHIETGKVSPNVSTLAKLADALDCELGDFFPKGQAALFAPGDLELQRLQRLQSGQPSEWRVLPTIEEWRRGELTAEEAMRRLAAEVGSTAVE